MQAAIPIHPDKVAIVTHYLEKYAGRKPYFNSAREQEWSNNGIQPPGRSRYKHSKGRISAAGGMKSDSGTTKLSEERGPSPTCTTMALEKSVDTPIRWLTPLDSP